MLLLDQNYIYASSIVVIKNILLGIRLPGLIF